MADPGPTGSVVWVGAVSRHITRRCPWVWELRSVRRLMKAVAACYRHRLKEVSPDSAAVSLDAHRVRAALVFLENTWRMVDVEGAPASPLVLYGAVLEEIARRAINTPPLAEKSIRAVDEGIAILTEAARAGRRVGEGRAAMADGGVKLA